MDPIERMAVAGSAGLVVGMLVLFLVGLASILTGRTSESLLRPVPSVDALTALIGDEQNDSADEQGPVERQPAVAAVEATPAPVRRPGSPSPTPTPAGNLIELPTTLIGARLPNETPLSLPPAALPTTTPGPSASPATTPRAIPGAQPTPLSTPFDPCLQAESGIEMNHNHMRIKRGSLVAYEPGVLLLATADGLVSLMITVETQVIGDLGVAKQVRVEAQLTGNGKAMAKLVEVLCPQG